MHGAWCSHRGGPLCGVHSAVHTVHGGFTEREVHTCVQIWTSKFWALGGRFGRPLCSCHASRPRPTRSLPPLLHPRLVGSTLLCALSGSWVQFPCELESDCETCVLRTDRQSWLLGRRLPVLWNHPPARGLFRHSCVPVSVPRAVARLAPSPLSNDL